MSDDGAGEGRKAKTSEREKQQRARMRAKEKGRRKPDAKGFGVGDKVLASIQGNDQGSDRVASKDK